MNSKMSILTMQKTKFKVNKTKSSFKLSSSFGLSNLNNSLISVNKESKFLCSIEETQNKNENEKGFS